MCVFKNFFFFFFFYYNILIIIMVFDERNNCLFCTESFPNVEISISIESYIRFMTDNLKTNWKNTYCWFHLLSPISNTYLAPASALLTAFSLIVSVKNQMKKIKLIHNRLTYFATKYKLWWQWKTLTRGATLPFKFKFKTVLNFFENMRYIKKLMFLTKFLSTLTYS